MYVDFWRCTQVISFSHKSPQIQFYVISFLMFFDAPTEPRTSVPSIIYVETLLLIRGVWK